MKIVEKGWAVWFCLQVYTPIYQSKISAIYAAGFMDEKSLIKSGYRVLHTTATATVAKKKARKK